MLTFGSVCSGIEAASVAWEDLGFKAQWLAECDAFPSAVLKHRYPNIPNLGDMTQLNDKDAYNDRSINILVGGTPCQSFSIAGMRGGLDDERGNLALEFCRILLQKRPRWFIWENVPGVLSNNNGKDFGTILGAMGQCGYGFAYRVLDAQYFGVPQRRRRVFVIGYFGDWRPPAAVLLERESLSWDFAPGGKAIQRIADRIAESTGSESPKPYRMTAFGEYEQDDTFSTIKARDHKDATDLIAFSCKNHGNDAMVNKSPALRAMDGERLNGGGQVAVCYLMDRAAFNQGKNAKFEPYIEKTQTSPTITARGPHAVMYENHAQDCRVKQVTVSPTISAKACTGGENLPLVRDNYMVRRLTPREGERLQGFPDDWTRVPWRGRPADQCPDSPRYKAVGNSMSRHVMHWLGKRIKTFEEEIINA